MQNQCFFSVRLTFALLSYGSTEPIKLMQVFLIKDFYLIFKRYGCSVTISFSIFCI